VSMCVCGGGGIKVGEKEVKEDRVMEGAQEYKEVTHYFQISPNNHGLTTSINTYSWIYSRFRELQTLYYSQVLIFG